MNYRNPQISILMPVYNTAPYLREAMDSILSQTFDDFELIVLDDCTPDESPSILDSYTDPRIVRYRGEKNVGLANVLNVGMDMARGKYIARMDSDDISLPDRLQIQYNYLESHPEIDLVSVGMQQFGADNRTMRYDNTTEDIKFNALFFSPILHASSMWRRERFAFLRFEQEHVPAEDYRMWTRALASGLKMRNLPEILYRYRMHMQQATSQSERVTHAEEKVRTAYMRHIFPSAKEEQISQWNNIRQYAETEPDTMLTCFEEMELCNQTNLFFDPNYFHRRYLRHYQAALYNLMRTKGIQWSHLSRLRLPQIVKLIFKKR